MNGKLVSQLLVKQSNVQAEVIQGPFYDKLQSFTSKICSSKFSIWSTSNWITLLVPEWGEFMRFGYRYNGKHERSGRNKFLTESEMGILARLWSFLTMHSVNTCMTVNKSPYYKWCEILPHMDPFPCIYSTLEVFMLPPFSYVHWSERWPTHRGQIRTITQFLSNKSSAYIHSQWCKNMPHFLK